LRRGFDVKKFKKALIVEDVITTGKSSIECANAIKKLGCDISGFACIIDRSSGKSLIEHKIISEITLDIPTYEPNQIPDYLKNINPIKPGSRDI
jgi:orotate phosphoribosyltransferase